MNKVLVICLLTFVGSAALNGQALKSEMDSVSYSAGVIVAKNLKQQGLNDMNPDLFLEAVMAVINDKGTIITASAAEAYFRNYQKKKKDMEGEINRIAGEEFLAANAKREGVVVLDNGLQYEVMQEGNGPKPQVTDEVLTHYHGTLIDGRVFDSSVDRGEPISFPLNRVISGWTEILQLMPVGSKWKVYIPSNMAYGERGAGPLIGPNSTLIFEIELIEIK